MAKYIIDEATMRALADATRYQTGGSEELSPSAMTNEITNMVNYIIDDQPCNLLMTQDVPHNDVGNHSLICYSLTAYQWLVDTFGNLLGGLEDDTYEIFIDDVSIKKVTYNMLITMQKHQLILDISTY